jgi:threonine dehydrogenase-like Zn-dependent dehydrogenase
LPAEVLCPVNCATATVAAAFRAAGPIKNRRVLIFGAGMLGLTAAAFARSHGASSVVVCESNPRRLDCTQLFGADSAVEWHPDFDELRQRLSRDGPAELFDVIVELSGSPEAVEMTFRLGEVGGTIVLVGSVMKTRRAEIDPENIVRRWLSVHGVHNYAPEDLRTAVAFLERSGSQYPFAQLVECTYSLADVNAAIERAVQMRPIRIAVRP